jgi:hypothetical protein
VIEDAETLKDDIRSFFSVHDSVSLHAEEELISVEHWFNKKSDEARRDAFGEVDEDSAFDKSLKDIGLIMSSMGSLREKMSSVADKLVSRMLEIVKNDESKRLMKEQQDRFATEISIIMEALQVLKKSF